MKILKEKRNVAFFILDLLLLIFLTTALFSGKADPKIVYLGFLLQILTRSLFKEISSSIRVEEDAE